MNHDEDKKKYGPKKSCQISRIQMYGTQMSDVFAD